MPTYAKSEDWLHQSQLLLDARPETTRVTTSYNIKPARRRTKAENASAGDGEAPATPEKPPRGHLIIKTYDPVSGVSLKYKTSKAAEVGRLVQMLSGLGRKMAALPPVEEASTVEGGEPMTGVEGGGSGAQTPVAAAVTAQQGGNAGGGKGKKKKGKR
ncbi:signal recognition particle 9 kDa protein-domain-containing protein [Podospora aff. communis PSN243]|uniref:Signal recognition particle 9 kDa protein-domain-containing protein n=1 Tax=Podospora aff. communis PSN243 TaxID=3040156 RepID=A0AAV9H7F9_9PEZI|nr:signal recognition particle 9 kDa protein-domain-containing protein [Podospora aff. communis PSN243]